MRGKKKQKLMYTFVSPSLTRTLHTLQSDEMAGALAAILDYGVNENGSYIWQRDKKRLNL